MDLQEKQLPLVSVIVITYNSEKYVLETLESAKAQTYQNIELIVSDDCSTDNTVEICRKWIEENRERFVRTELITFEKNTGVPANANRGLIAAEGEWLKFIAGDDIILPHCIETSIKFIRQDIKVILSEIFNFKDSIDVNIKKLEKGRSVNQNFINLESAKKQFIYFLKGFYIPAPGTFFERKKLVEFGGFDEQFFFLEDIPLYLKYTCNNIRIYYIPYVLSGHRRHSHAITAKTGKTVAYYMKEVYEAIIFYTNFQRNLLLKINAKWHLWVIKTIFLIGNKGFICEFINSIRLKLQPLRLYNLLIKMRIIRE